MESVWSICNCRDEYSRRVLSILRNARNSAFFCGKARIVISWLYQLCDTFFWKCDRRCSQLGQVFARLIVTTIGPNMGFFLVIFILLVIQSSEMVPAMRWRIASRNFRAYQCFDYMFVNFFLFLSGVDLTKMFVVITQKEHKCFA